MPALLVMFAGLMLTAFGSAYYHLEPGNARLVWDRIPIMMVFMALLAAVSAERVSVLVGLCLLPALQAAVIGSVLLWRAGELSATAIYASTPQCRYMPSSFCCFLLLVPAKYTRSLRLRGCGWLPMSWRRFSRKMTARSFGLGHIVSGQTLKHLAAAAGYWILRMLQKREVVRV